MINPNTEYRLGNKSFVVLSLRPTFIAVVIFILGLFLSALSGIYIPLINIFVSGMKSADSAGMAIDASPFVFMVIALVFILAFLIFGIGVLISWLEYRFFTFNLQEFDLKIKKGIININEMSVPFRQIQNIDVSRGLWYRVFGVSRLVLITAGHDDGNDNDQTEIVFDPVDKNLAEEMRTILQSKIGVQIVEEEKK